MGKLEGEADLGGGVELAYNRHLQDTLIEVDCTLVVCACEQFQQVGVYSNK